MLLVCSCIHYACRKRAFTGPDGRPYKWDIHDPSVAVVCHIMSIRHPYSDMITVGSYTKMILPAESWRGHIDEATAS